MTATHVRCRHPRSTLQDPHVLQVTGEFGAEHVRAIEADPRIRGLELQERYQGFTGSDLGFLDELRQIVALRVKSSRVRDLGVLARMPWLEEIDIECRGAPLPSLRDSTSLVSAQVGVGGNVLGTLDAPRLVRAFLEGFPTATLEPAAGHPTLERLGVQSRVLETLVGAREVPRLQRLVIHSTRSVKSAEGVEGHPKMRALWFIHCKGLKSLEPVGTLASLHCFMVSDGGVLDSPAPLLRCRRLRSLDFAGSTSFKDPRVSVLAELPLLMRFKLNGKRHYDIRASALMEGIYARRRARGR